MKKAVLMEKISYCRMWAALAVAVACVLLYSASPAVAEPEINRQDAEAQNRVNTGTDKMAPDARNDSRKDDKKWIGAFGSVGVHHHIWSSSDYKGYKQNTFGVYWESVSGGLIPLPVDTERTFRWVLRYSRLWGTFEIDPDQVPDEKRTGGPYYTTLDHYQIAVLCIRRWVFLPDYFIRPTLHLGFGVSLLNKTIIEDGTLHNFNFVGGGGLEMDLSDRWSAYLNVRWEHYSNGGQIYLTNSAVIGPESINGVFGIRFRYN